MDETRKRLLAYLPPFMQQFKEIKAIMQVTNPETDAVFAGIQKCLKDGFIGDCDEYGIKKYESMLGIKPDIGESLESRKLRVLVRWNDAIPYTYRTLLQKLNVLCGVNNYDIQSDLENYYIGFRTKLELANQVKELEELLEKMLPQNMYYETFNHIECHTEGMSLVSGGLCYVDEFMITNDSRERISVQSESSASIGVVTTEFFGTGKEN